MKFVLTLTPPQIFLRGAPKILNQFWILLFMAYCHEKFGPHPMTLREWKNFAPIFGGGRRVPIGVYKLDTTACKNLKWLSPLTPEQGQFEYWKTLIPQIFFWGGEPPKFYNHFWILLFRACCQEKFGPCLPTLGHNVGAFGAPKF